MAPLRYLLGYLSILVVTLVLSFPSSSYSEVPLKVSAIYCLSQEDTQNVKTLYENFDYTSGTMALFSGMVPNCVYGSIILKDYSLVDSFTVENVVINIHEVTDLQDSKAFLVCPAAVCKLQGTQI